MTQMKGQKWCWWVDSDLFKYSPQCVDRTLEMSSRWGSRVYLIWEILWSEPVCVSCCDVRITQCLFFMLHVAHLSTLLGQKWAVLTLCWEMGPAHSVEWPQLSVVSHHPLIDHFISGRRHFLALGSPWAPAHMLGGHFFGNPAFVVIRLVPSQLSVSFPPIQVEKLQLYTTV